MKKYLKIFLCLTIIFTLVGCGKEDKKDEKDTKDEVKEEKTEENKDNISITYEEVNYNKGTIKNTRNYPVVKTGDGKIGEEISKSIKAISDGFWSDVVDMTDNVIANGSKEEVGVTHKFSVLYQNKKVLTFMCQYDGSFGGAMWTQVDYYSYDLETGKLIKFKDLFNNKDEVYKKALAKIQSDYKTEIARDEFFEEYKETLKKGIDVDGIYGIDKGGVIFAIGKGYLAPNATGDIGFKLDYNDIKDLFVKDYWK